MSKNGPRIKKELKSKKTPGVDQPCLAPTTALRSTFSQHVLAEITVNNISGQALVDTGSTNSYQIKNL